MSTSSKRGLSFTLSWGALEAPRSAEIPLGVMLKLSFLASLCAGSYVMGRRAGWIAHQSTQTSGVVIVERRDSKPEPAAPASASGNPVGDKPDVITPLNVRDPSALVMGPGATDAPPPVSVPAPSAAPRSAPHMGPAARVYPPKEDAPSPDARF